MRFLVSGGVAESGKQMGEFTFVLEDSLERGILTIPQRLSYDKGTISFGP